MYTNKLLAALILSLLACAPVFARERNTSQDNELLLWGDPVVVTASKTELRVQEAPASVSVIDDQTIKDSGATSIPELLRSVAGVDVMEPNDSQSDVAIRGLNKEYADKLLVMVDGRSIYQDFFGVVFWRLNPLLMSQIKRIEVVRGPGSALYGANAFSGTINIITKTPAELQKGLAGRVQMADHRGQYLDSTFSASRLGGWDYSFGAGYNKSDGLGGRKTGQARDSYFVPTFTADALRQLPRGTLRLSLGSTQAVADLSSSLILHDAHWNTSNITVNYSEDKTRNPLSVRYFINRFTLTSKSTESANDTTNDLEVQKEFHLSSAHDLIYGGSYRQVAMKSSTTGPLGHPDTLKSLFLQDQWIAAKKTTLFTGVRYDLDSLHGSNLSPHLSLVHHLSANRVLRASYGTAFRSPTLVSTYIHTDLQLFPGVFLHTLGNPNLKPEKMKSYEVGYREENKHGFVGVNAYYNEVSNLITPVAVDFAPSPPFPPGIPLDETFVNKDNAKIMGMELEAEKDLQDNTKLSFNYSYENVREAGKTGAFAPLSKANFSLQTDPRRRFSFYTVLHYVGPSTGVSSDGGPHPLRDYSRVDTNLSYKVGSHGLVLGLGGTNILDDHHMEVPVSTDPGSAPEATSQARTLWVSLSGPF
jgi:outer membrane receptor for ferrienterochelin and colicin